MKHFSTSIEYISKLHFKKENACILVELKSVMRQFLETFSHFTEVLTGQLNLYIIFATFWIDCDIYNQAYEYEDVCTSYIELHSLLSCEKVSKI